MPSLRRTVSNPVVVRSSPYSTAVLSTRGGGHRRSSGSDTTTRRVLADIDWWKVTEGQCDSSFEDDRNRGVVDPPQLEVTLGLGIPVTHVDEGVDHLSASPSFPTTANGSVESVFGLTTEQFAGLSITPHTPTRRNRSLESSPSSSPASTPQRSRSPVRGLGLLFTDFDTAFSEPALPPLHRKERGLDSFFDTLDEDDIFAPRYAYADFAVSPLCSAPSFLD